MCAVIYLSCKEQGSPLRWVAIEYGDRLYTLDMLVAGIEELLLLGHGMGPDHPDYVDVVLSAEALDPFDFNRFLTLADNVEKSRSRPGECT